MARHHLPDVMLPGTEWTSYDGGQFGSPRRTHTGGVTIESNVDASCFSIRQTEPNGDEDLIHFCDWPMLRKTVDEFMAERERIAREDGDWHGD